jgi:hypothetical protein
LFEIQKTRGVFWKKGGALDEKWRVTWLWKLVSEEEDDVVKLLGIAV